MTAEVEEWDTSLRGRKYVLPRFWLFVVSLIAGKTLLLLSDLYTFPLALYGTMLGLFMTVLIASAAFLFRERGQDRYVFALNLLVSLAFFVDAVYSRAFGYLISLHMLAAGHIADGMGESVLSLLRWNDALYFVDLPVLVLLMRRRSRQPGGARRTGTFFFLAVLSVVTISQQFARAEVGSHLSDRRMTPLMISPLGVHALDLWDVVTTAGKNLDARERADIDTWLQRNVPYQAPDPAYAHLAGALRGKNLVVIQFESLENFLIGRRFYGQEITPNLNRLLGTSYYFSNIVQQVKDGNSSDAELLFNTSTYPLSSGAAFLRFPDSQYVTFPAMLRRAGYSAVAVHGDGKEFWNRDRVFPVLGYERYVTEEQFADRRQSGMGVLDEPLFAESLGVAKQLSEPFLLDVITLTSHVPFKIPTELKRLDAVPPDEPTSDYLQSILYADAALGDFYDGLESAGLLKDTVVVIYGDHEGIHKYFETPLPGNASEVPFIVNVPGLRGMEVNTVGGQVDMMPTLAFLFGLDSAWYQDKVMGRNLFGRHSGSGILSSGQVLAGVDEPEHIAQGHRIADLIISGNYFRKS